MIKEKKREQYSIAPKNVVNDWRNKRCLDDDDDDDDMMEEKTRGMEKDGPMCTWIKLDFPTVYRKQ